MSEKIDKRIDQATDKAHEATDKAADKVRELAHAVTDKARVAAERTGNAFKQAGGKIKKWVH